MLLSSHHTSGGRRDVEWTYCKVLSTWSYRERVRVGLPSRWPKPTTSDPSCERYHINSLAFYCNLSSPVAIFGSPYPKTPNVERLLITFRVFYLGVSQLGPPTKQETLYRL